MVFLILGILLLVIGLALAGRVLYMHWHEIRLLDPESVKEEQEKRKREELVVRRLRRVGSEKLQPFRVAARSFRRGYERAYTTFEARAKRMEKLYQQAREPLRNMVSHEERIGELLQQAKSFARDLKWSEAEALYVEAIGLDRRTAEPYRGLAMIYLRQKLYDQAKETLLYLVKMKQADDATYAGLAEVTEAQNDLTKSKTYREQAIAAAPNSGHRYAELGEFYLRQGKAKQALAQFKQALDYEAASAKYLELSLEAAILLGDRKEAEALYDRLRLVTEDAVRFRRWKAKIDELQVSGSHAEAG